MFQCDHYILCFSLLCKVKISQTVVMQIITYHDTLLHFWFQLPFPSITICPHTKLKQSVCNDSCFKEMQHRHDNTDFSEKYIVFYRSRKLTWFGSFSSHSSTVQIGILSHFVELLLRYVSYDAFFHRSKFQMKNSEVRFGV